MGNSQVKKDNLLLEKKVGKSSLFSANMQNDATIYYLALINELRMKETVRSSIRYIKEEVIKTTAFFSIVIFGSYSISKQTKDSDLDIAVLIENTHDAKQIQINLSTAKLKSLVPIDEHVITRRDLFKCSPMMMRIWASRLLINTWLYITINYFTICYMRGLSMDSDSKLYIDRAQNEINLSKMIMAISQSEKIQEEIFNMPNDTYYNAAISHAYYSIFYMTKAYLLTKGIITRAPEEHKKTYEEFESLVNKGEVDVELLRIYEQMIMRAEALPAIFRLEKGKRGRFTYKTLPQANIDPAKESVTNAEIFFKHVNKLCE